MKLRLHLFYFVYKNCGDTFKFPSLPEGVYGEFLLKTKTGKIAYLNAINNKVFEEFSFLLKKNNKISSIQDIDRAKILHRIFGIACDRASDGSAYSIIQKPTCPICKEVNIGSWEPTNPPEFIGEFVEQVTYIDWVKLAKNEKEDLIDSAVNISLTR